MNSIKRPVLLVLLAVGIIVALALFLRLLTQQSSTPNQQQASDVPRGVEGKPIDIALSYYEDWLSARRATDTDPFEKGLLNDPRISTDLSNKLAAYKGDFRDGSIDPVLCQTNVPNSIRTVPVFNTPSSTELLVVSAQRNSSDEATVDLTSNDGKWMITGIACGSGESAGPAPEYTFDHEGYLLNELPKPLDPTQWYLVFVESGVPGHTAPLILGSDSMCTMTDGTAKPCSTDLFSKAEPAHVQGTLSEAGVEVKKIEFLDHEPQP